MVEYTMMQGGIPPFNSKDNSSSPEAVAPARARRPLRASKRKLFLAAIALLVVTVASVPLLVKRSQAVLPAALPPPPASVGCRGVIEPEAGVIKVAVPYFDGGPSIIKELKVKEGDWVKRGEVLAVLDGRGPLEAAYQDSAARVEVARQQLAQVKAGAKPADLEAQRQEIARWESEYKITQADYGRYEKLRQTEDVSASELDEKRLLLDRTRFMLEMEKERMASMAEVRPQDIEVAVAELKSSITAMNHTSANLELMLVRSPVPGRVLKVHAHEGEQVGPQGILELGQTDRMYVAAEVYEDDVARVRPGQTATISSAALPRALEGTVEQIGMEVARSETLPTDPAAFSDARVIKVKIRLADSQAVANLVNGKVDVVIHP